MRNKNLGTLPKKQRIKLFVESFEKSNIEFQDVIDEYKRLRKRNDKKFETE